MSRGNLFKAIAYTFGRRGLGSRHWFLDDMDPRASTRTFRENTLGIERHSSLALAGQDA